MKGGIVLIDIMRIRNDIGGRPLLKRIRFCFLGNFRMKKSAFLFDVDGVIVRTEMFSIQYQQEFGVPNEDMFAFFSGVFQDCLIGKADLKEAVQPYLKRWKWTGDVDGLLLYWFASEHKIDHRIINVISRLQKSGIKCYLATNQEKYRTQYMKKEMGFESLFDSIFSSAEIGSKKPEPEFYERVFRELAEQGISKEQMLFIDDSCSHIAVAKALGIDTHLYKSFDSFYALAKPLLD